MHFHFCIPSRKKKTFIDCKMHPDFSYSNVEEKKMHILELIQYYTQRNLIFIRFLPKVREQHPILSASLMRPACFRATITEEKPGERKGRGK